MNPDFDNFSSPGASRVKATSPLSSREPEVPWSPAMSMTPGPASRSRPSSAAETPTTTLRDSGLPSSIASSAPLPAALELPHAALRELRLPESRFPQGAAPVDDSVSRESEDEGDTRHVLGSASSTAFSDMGHTAALERNMEGDRRAHAYRYTCRRCVEDSRQRRYCTQGCSSYPHDMRASTMIQKAGEIYMQVHLSRIAARVREGIMDEVSLGLPDHEAYEKYTRSLRASFMEVFPGTMGLTMLRDLEQTADSLLDDSSGHFDDSIRASRKREVVNADLRRLMEIARPGDALPPEYAKVA